MPPQPNLAERGMALSLRALTRLASSDLLDRLGIREGAERFLHGAAKTSVADGGPRRAHVLRRHVARAARPASRGPPARGVFDLTPTDEQQMLREAVRDFARDRVRPAAEAADAACAAPAELLTQANELGLSMIGVPEELGGAVQERSAVTAVLMAEALAHGDMGFAAAALRAGRRVHRAQPVGRRGPAGRPTCRRSSATTSRGWRTSPSLVERVERGQHRQPADELGDHAEAEQVVAGDVAQQLAELSACGSPGWSRSRWSSCRAGGR